MTPVLETRRLVVEYESDVRALDGVDLSISRDELVSIIGPSGAGKSTLLRIMNRLLTPTSGQVLLEGEDISNASGRSLRAVRHRVGMVFQQFNLVPQLTVLENVLVGWIAGAPPLHRIPALWRQFPAFAKREAMECLERVHVAERAHARAGELSGGQQQRVAIARVLMQRPAVILADEPIASLDPRSAEIVMRTLQSICRTESVPVIVNLHQVDVAKTYATRLVGLRQGSVVFDAAPSEIGDHELDRLYTSRSSAKDDGPPAEIVIRPEALPVGGIAG